MSTKKSTRKTADIKTTGRVNLGAMLAAIGKNIKPKKKANKKPPNKKGL